MGPSSKDKRKKKNKSRRDALHARTEQFYRRKQGLKLDEDETNLAGYFRRVGQYTIDVLISSFVSLVFLAVLEIATGESIFPPIIYVIPQLLVGLFYFVPSYTRTGQTFGCKKLKIVIIRADGTGYISKTSAFIRWFTLFLFPNLYVFILSQGQDVQTQIGIAMLGLIITFIIVAPVFVTKNRRGIHDSLGGSIVVSEW